MILLRPAFGNISPGKEKAMRRLRLLVVLVLISLLAASAAMAQQDYQQIGGQSGVKVMVRYNPFGYNNLIVAFIRFVNTNSHKVDVDWTPLIKCEGRPVKKGYGEPFSISKKGSYEVTLWRSQACGHATLKAITVRMTVKQEGY